LHRQIGCFAGRGNFTDPEAGRCFDRGLFEDLVELIAGRLADEFLYFVQGGMLAWLDLRLTLRLRRARRMGDRGPS